MRLETLAEMPTETTDLEGRDSDYRLTERVATRSSLTVSTTYLKMFTSTGSDQEPITNTAVSSALCVYYTRIVHPLLFSGTPVLYLLPLVPMVAGFLSLMCVWKHGGTSCVPLR